MEADFLILQNQFLHLCINMHVGLFDKRCVKSNEIGSLAFGLTNLHDVVIIVSTRSNK